MDTLKPVYNVIEEIAKTPSILSKKEIVSKAIQDDTVSKNLKRVVIYALDPFKKFKTKEIFYKKNNSANIEKAFEKLDYLSEARGCKDEDVEELSELASVDKETWELFFRIINKDLRCGIGTKVFSDYMYIPDYNVMLCEDDITKFEDLAGDISEVCWSEKLDGVRCTAFVNINKQEVEYFSRNGKEFKNFKTFNSEILELAKELNKTNNFEIISFDGEAISSDKKFDKLMSQVQKLNDVKSDIFRFCIFDCPTLASETLEKRIEILKGLENNLKDKLKVVSVLDHIMNVGSYKELIDISNRICDMGGEGIVAKIKSSLYENKRSRSWCKIKKFYSADLNVVDFEYGKKGKKHENRLGALFVDYKGVRVKVGSGYSDQEREEFIKDLPKMIEVRFQEVTKDGSLRFPVYIKVRDDK